MRSATVRQAQQVGPGHERAVVRPKALLRGSIAAVVVSLAGLVFGAGSAQALFGDGYGLAPINGHPDAIQPAPAIPGDHAFWAGACNLADAPGFGSDLGVLGGFGARRDFVLAGAGGAIAPRIKGPAIQVQVPVPAAELPEHCLDFGSPAGYPDFQGRLWASFPYDTGVPHISGVGTIGQAGPAGLHSPGWRLPPVTQAGAHPDGSTMFMWGHHDGRPDDLPDYEHKIDGSVDNVYVDLPPGFVGNPQAVPYCTGEQFAQRPLRCPPESQVGVLRLDLEAFNIGTPSNYLGVYDTTYPVYNLEPRKGRVAELGFGYAADFAAVRLVADARTNGDFGVTAFTGQIPAALTPIGQEITLWGVPWAAENDAWRPKLGHWEGPRECLTTASMSPTTHQLRPEVIPPTGLPAGSCRASHDPSWGPIRPFFSTQTECSGSSVTVTMRTDAYQRPGAFTPDGFPDPADPDWKTYSSDSPPVTGCEKLAFDANATFSPTSSSADGASGLEADIDLAQNNDPPPGLTAAQAHDFWRSDAGLATSQLDKTVVTLPEGLTLNPSSAAGLEACSNEQIGVREVGNPYLFHDTEPSCPDGSKIGTVQASTPLLAEPLSGEMYLGTPESTDPRSGRMFRLFLVLRDPERGLLVKVFGTATADGSVGGGGTGRLTATFDNNPRVPVDNIKVSLKGGGRGVLALPQRCGSYTTDAVFSPWSGGQPDPSSSSFQVDGCANAFAPGLVAGMDTPAARAHGSFSFRFSRREGDQHLHGLTATLPEGLLASVRDVPLCSNAQADAGGCPQSSRIGLVDAKAGSGDPFVLEDKGEVFLTEGYKGGQYGLAVKIRPVAGPFRGSMELSPIVVRQAIHVDRATAQVTAISDPFPLVHHGVPLRVREVIVLVDRGGFMLNPSDCSAKQVGADLRSDQGTTATPTAGFQAAGCANLRFKPRLKLRLTGRRQVRTGRHPGIRATVTQQGTPEAGIRKAEVRLPKSLALDVDNAQALCEHDQGTRPDLENHCPKGSIVGRAKAISPLLNRPLVGNVYFVKNVRRSASGNTIRTLPMIVVALRGEIAINLKGESNVKRGKLVNTFNQVPDAPVTRFNLNIRGGRNGIVAVTRTRRSLIDLCNSGRQTAEADLAGHNGRRHDRNIAMRKPCAKQKKAKTKRGKANKRDAKRKAARRHRGR